MPVTRCLVSFIEYHPEAQCSLFSSLASVSVLSGCDPYWTAHDITVLWTVFDFLLYARSLFGVI